MKQRVIAIASTAVIVIQLLCLCQVQGGIITNQQSLTLPSEIADAQTTAATADLNGDNGNNSTRSGRVTYTASYSNVRVASKMDKSLKFFPSTPILKKPQAAAVHAPVGPVLRLSSTTTTTTTTSTTTEQPSSTSSTTTTAQPVEQESTLPEIVEIVEEEVEPTEVATEAVEFSSGERGVTEQSED